MKNRNEILKRMLNVFISIQNKVSDLEDGSVIKSLFEGVAFEIEDVYRWTDNNFKKMLQIVPEIFFNFKKRNGMKTKGEVILISDVVAQNNITIPKGVIVATDSGLEYETVTDVLLPKGKKESNPVIVVAKEVGQSYNIKANEISQVVLSSESIITKAKNTQDFLGGRESEDDDTYQSRFRDFVIGLQNTSIAGLKTGVMSVNGVSNVHITEHFPPKNKLYNVTIIIDSGTNVNDPNLLNIVKEIIEGNTINKKGYKASGIAIEYLQSKIANIDFDLDVKIKKGYDKQIINDFITETIKNFVDTKSVSEDIIVSKLVSVLASNHGIDDIKIKSPGSNQIIDDETIARTGKIEIGEIT